MFVNMRRIVVMLLIGISNAFAGPGSIAVAGLTVDRNEYGIATISGQATNQADKVAKSVFIRFDLFDAQGALVGNTITHAQNLKPGAKWNFQVQAVEKFTRVEMSGVEVFE